MHAPSVLTLRAHQRASHSERESQERLGMSFATLSFVESGWIILLYVAFVNHHIMVDGFEMKCGLQCTQRLG